MEKDCQPAKYMPSWMASLSIECHTYLYILRTTTVQKMAFCRAKDGLSPCKRWLIAAQKTVFCRQVVRCSAWWQVNISSRFIRHLSFWGVKCWFSTLYNMTDGEAHPSGRLWQLPRVICHATLRCGIRRTQGMLKGCGCLHWMPHRSAAWQLPTALQTVVCLHCCFSKITWVRYKEVITRDYDASVMMKKGKEKKNANHLSSVSFPHNTLIISALYTDRRKD